MTDLLSEDTEKKVSCDTQLSNETIANWQVLDIHVFVTGGYITEGAKEGMHGEDGRIKMNYGELDIAYIIKDELRERRGRNVVLCEYGSELTSERLTRFVLVCVRTSVADQARQTVQEELAKGKKGIRLMELPLKPV
jgi:hypothetical protein